MNIFFSIMGFPQNPYLMTFSVTVAKWSVYQMSQRHKTLLNANCQKIDQNGRG